MTAAVRSLNQVQISVSPRQNGKTPVASQAGSAPAGDEVPVHPTHNRREIVGFIVLVIVVGAASYGLSRFPRFEVWSLYVLGLGIPLGLLAIGLFRRVRCPRCGTALKDNRRVKIAGRPWIVLRCRHCRGEWRLKEEHPAP
jgi:hypothetical protein